jgi:hypothetical protein
MPKLGRSFDIADLNLNAIYKERTEMFRSTIMVDGVHVGWHQDSSGNLYHYDGVIWDVVPEMRVNQLEYLGEGND